MKKDIYMAPEVEIIKLSIQQHLLEASSGENTNLDLPTEDTGEEPNF